MRSPLSALRGGGRVVRGGVSSAGAITSGVGFTVTRTGVGLFTIAFLTPFASPPEVTATVNDQSGVACRITDTSIPTATGFTLRTSSTAGLGDFPFTFIAAEQER